MIRAVLVLIVSLWAGMAGAQEFTGLARLDPFASRVTDQRGGGIGIELYLSQTVPWRVFTLDNPRRLVMDFREIDWRGVDKAALLQTDRASDLRFGTLRPGWSRLVLDLAGPLTVTRAGMTVDPVTATAKVTVRLDPVDEAGFRAAAGAPADPDWAQLSQTDTTLPPPEPQDDGLLIVVLDPGHGGIDPGAEGDGMVEASVVLSLAQTMAEAINRTPGMRAVLTRTSDVFVPLEERMTIARGAGADLMVSIHADILEEDARTSGAAVYTLSRDGVDQASARMAERHDRGDLLAGLDLTGADDTVAMALMDLARQQTAPKALRFADSLIAAMEEGGVRLNSHSHRQAELAVLNAADFPSVLLEAGFLSSERDRERLQSDAGRAALADAMVAALTRWQAEEAATPRFGD